MGHWDGTQGQAKMVKKTQKLPYLWRSPEKSSNPKQKNSFFDFDYKTCCIRRGFKQLSSSTGWQVMAKRVPAPILAISERKGLKGRFR